MQHPGDVTHPSDELALRAGLPAAFRYLERECARADWPTIDIHPTAYHWLEVHGWFRGMMTDLTELGENWQGGRIEASSYRLAAIPRLRQLLSNLHGHHHHESENYFPALAALEPAMAKGFELLDRDHAAIELMLSDMAQAGTALNQAAASGADLSPHAAALAQAIDASARLIGRHLADEEDIIVPVLTLRGDPLSP